MSRKDDPKSNDATVVSVNIEDFTKTRDSVIICLSQLQSAVADLSRAYINHTSTVLNPGSSGLDLGGITSGISNSLLESGLLGARPASPGAKSEVGEKKKRKRAPPDPNAPKRALTPFFLYMQHNRPKIAEELGAAAKPKEVSDEGTRRWAEMPEPQKEVWKKLYADNLAVYKEKMKAYKAGIPFTDDDSARAANQLQQDVEGVSGSGAEETDDEDEDEEEAQEPRQEEEEEEDESSPEPEPVKVPTPPRPTSTKRRRSEGKTKEVSTPVTEKKESPEKKKRTSARKAAEESAPASARKAASTDNKRSKKKRKSEANADE